MNAAWSKNFAEVKQNRMQQGGGNRGSNPNVGYLADTAGGVIMPVGVGVRSNLQEEEKRKQRQRNDDGCGQPAIRPGPCQLHCAYCKQTLPPEVGRIEWKKVPLYSYLEAGAVQGRNPALVPEI